MIKTYITLLILCCTIFQTKAFDCLHSVVEEAVYNYLAHESDETEKSEIDNYDQGLADKFADHISCAKKPVYHPICRISIVNFDHRIITTETTKKISTTATTSMGTGCLICHSKDPTILGILTAAHVAEEFQKDKGSKCSIYFSAEGMVERRMLREPIYLDPIKKRYGVDLAIIGLDAYPDIPPAPRRRESIQRHENIFLHTAGYGQFYEKVLAGVTQETIGIFLINSIHMHATASYFKMEKNNSNSFHPKLETHYLSAKDDPENDWLKHPSTGEKMPSMPISSGFSGAPTFDTDNTIVGVQSRGIIKETTWWEPLDISHPYLGMISRAHKNISSISKNFILGTYVPTVENILMGASLIWTIYRTYQNFSFSYFVRSFFKMGSFFSLWSVINAFGTATNRYASIFGSMKSVEPGSNYSIAVPIEPWNDKIDKALEELNGRFPDLGKEKVCTPLFKRVLKQLHII